MKGMSYMRRSLKVSNSSKDTMALNGTALEYTVDYRNVKYPRLEFKTGNLVVILPKDVQDEKVLLLRKKAWIEKKHGQIQQALDRARTKLKGNSVTIFGKEFSLIHPYERPAVDLLTKTIRWNRNNPHHRKEIQKLLKNHLIHAVSMVFEDYIDKLKVRPKKIVIRKQVNKWGSYSKKGTLSLNFNLVFLPEELIRYVVFHELAHIHEPRHDQDFWSIIERGFDDIPGLEQRLLEYWFLTQVYQEELRLYK